MSKQKVLDRPRKVRTTLQELEVLARLKGTVELSIIKRVASRYIDNLKRISFKLSEMDPYLAIKHTDLVSQALGIRRLIKIIENAGEKLEKGKS